MGKENGAISDEQISASSEWSADYAAFLGRLHLKKAVSKAGGWVSATRDDSQWLQIDLGNPTSCITGVATQGRNGYAPGHWVTKYKVQYSDDGVAFLSYSKGGQIKVKQICSNETLLQYIT